MVSPEYSRSSLLAVLLLLTAYCSLLTRSAWAVDYYVNDCCTRNDVFTTVIGSSSAAGGCNFGAAPGNPARSIDYIFNNCALAANDRIFVDTGYYFSRRYTAVCTGGANAGNACKKDPATGDTPFNDAGPDGLLDINVNGISIIGAPGVGASSATADATDRAGVRLDARGIGANFEAAVYIELNNNIRIKNLRVVQRQFGVHVAGGANILLEGIIAEGHNDAGGDPGVGINIDTSGTGRRSDNIEIRNCVTDDNQRRGLWIQGVTDSVADDGDNDFVPDGDGNGYAVDVYNNLFYRSKDKEILIPNDGNGNPSNGVRLRNNVFQVDGGGKEGITVNAGNSTGFSSNYNTINLSGGADTGIWLGTTADDLNEWQCLTGGGANGCASSCAGCSAACGTCGGALCGQDANSGCSDPRVSTGNPNDNQYSLEAFYGRWDPVTWRFNLGDQNNTPALDSGSNNAADATKFRPYTAGGITGAENEGNEDRVNRGAYANWFRAERSSVNLDIAYGAASLDTDLATGGNQSATRGGRRDTIQIQLSMPAYSTSKAKITANSQLLFSDGANVVRAYLDETSCSLANCILGPGAQAMTVNFLPALPFPADLCTTTGVVPDVYTVGVNLRGYYVLRDRMFAEGTPWNTLSDLTTNCADATGLINNGSNPPTNGCAPFLADHFFTVGTTITHTGAGCGSTRRIGVVPGTVDTDTATPLVQTRIVAGTTGTAAVPFRLTLHNYGGAAGTVRGQVGGACDITDPTWIRLTDIDGRQTFVACLPADTAIGADADILPAVPGIDLSAASAVPGGAGGYCNGPVEIDARVETTAGEVTTPPVVDVLYVTASANANCTHAVPGYKPATPLAVVAAPLTVGGAEQVDLTIENLGQTDFRMDQEPAGSGIRTAICFQDAQGSVVPTGATMNCTYGRQCTCTSNNVDCSADPEGDCSQGAFDARDVTTRADESRSARFDIAAGLGTDWPVDGKICHGRSLVTLNVRGYEQTGGSPTLRDSSQDDAPVGSFLTVDAGCNNCLIYVAQSLAKLDVTTDDALVDNNVNVANAELGVQFEVQVFNSGTAAACAPGGATDFRFRVCDVAAGCPGADDYTADCFSINGASPCGPATCIAVGAVGTVRFAAVAGAFAPAAGTYDGTAPNYAFINVNVACGIDEPITPDQITVSGPVTGIGDKVTESGWIEIER